MRLGAKVEEYGCVICEGSLLWCFERETTLCAGRIILRQTHMQAEGGLAFSRMASFLLVSRKRAATRRFTSETDS